MRERYLSRGTRLFVAGALAAQLSGCMMPPEPAHPKAAVAAPQAAQSPKPRGVKELIAALGRFSREADEAVKDLVKMGKPAVPALIEFLKSPMPSAISPLENIARRNAVYVLLKIGIDKEGLLGIFTPMLDKERKPGEREAASVVLGKLGDKRAIPPLIEALKDGVEPAAVALAAIGLDGTVAFDEKLLDEVIGILRNGGKPEARMAAAKALAILKRPKALPALIAAMDDPDEQVREAAIEAVGEAGGASEIPALAKKLKDSSAVVRISAIRALKLNAPEDDVKKRKEVIGIISAALKDKEAEVREEAEKAVGELKEGDGEPGKKLPGPLGAIEDPSKRKDAVKALGKRGDMKAIDTLAEVLQKDDDSDVRKEAASALEDVAMDTEKDEPKLRKAMESDVKKLLKIIGALGMALSHEDETGTAGANEALESILGQVAKNKKLSGPVAKDAIRSLGNRKWEARRAAAEVLGMLRNETALPALNKVRINDYSRAVRAAAEEAMESIQSPEEAKDGIPLGEPEK